MERNTEMFLEEETINTRKKQAQVYAKVFQDKIKDIVTECKIQEEVYNGHLCAKAEEENVFLLGLDEEIMKNIKPKNSYGYDNIPMRILWDGTIHLAKPYHRLMCMTSKTTGLSQI